MAFLQLYSNKYNWPLDQDGNIPADFNNIFLNEIICILIDVPVDIIMLWVLLIDDNSVLFKLLDDGLALNTSRWQLSYY